MTKPNKNLLLLTLLFGLIFSNCRKKMDLPKPELETIFGTWEWVSSSGGFSGTSKTPASEGYTKTLEFKDNGLLYYRINSKKDKMEFTLSKGKSIYSINEATLISYKDIGAFDQDSAPLKQSVWFNGTDTLYLNDECYDCFGHIYLRKK